MREALLKYQKVSEHVSKTKQVVMLYDGVLKFLNRAKDCIDNNDITERYNNLIKATDILNGLQLALDQAQNVSSVLDNFYSKIIANLYTINVSNSAEELDNIMECIKVLRNTWDEIDRSL